MRDPIIMESARTNSPLSKRRTIISSETNTNHRQIGTPKKIIILRPVVIDSLRFDWSLLAVYKLISGSDVVTILPIKLPEMAWTILAEYLSIVKLPLPIKEAIMFSMIILDSDIQCPAKG